MVDLANREREDHIMTVEDPIEFLHSHKRCLVNQREVGEDTKSFANALKHVLRQDPDIILVGELRDLETISIALTAAETGHLRDGKTHQIYSAMQAGGRHGMQTMDQSLADLVRRGYLSYDKALESGPATNTVVRGDVLLPGHHLRRAQRDRRFGHRGPLDRLA